MQPSRRCFTFPVDEPHECLECGRSCVGRRSLGNHINRTHGLDLEAYTLKHLLNGVPPSCLCGCGKPVVWHRTQYRYCDFINGHNVGTRAPLEVAAPVVPCVLVPPVAAVVARVDAPHRKKKGRPSSPPSVPSRPIHIPGSSLQARMLHRVLDATASLIDPAAVPFVFADDDDAIISREELIRTNEVDLFPGAPGRDWTRDVLKPALHSFYQAYVRRHGWFYPRTQVTPMQALEQVRAHAVDFSSSYISSLGSAGSAFLKGTFNSYWDVDDGPSQSFWVDKKLDSVLRYRLGLNTSRPYRYELSDGTQVECHETFEINIKNIRYGFIVQRAAVSWFKPAAAYEVYRRFLGDNPTPVVWDPSCGFGARLLGFVAAYPKGTYIGTDPASKTFRDLCGLRHDLQSVCPGLEVDLHQQGSEGFKPQLPLDLVFSSPPYFDREKYYSEPGQCWRDYPNEQDWYKSYLVPTFKNAFEALKPKATMVINIDERNEQIVTKAALEVGFIQQQSMRLKIGRDHFSKKHGHNDKDKSEPILVFIK